MKDYGKVRSTIRPKMVDVKETKVFLSTNVKEVDIEDIDLFDSDSSSHIEYEYDLVEYSTEEYISKLHADLDFIAMMSDIPLEVID